MTKVQLHYDLMHPLTDADAEGIANVHSYYGIARVFVAPSLDRITVDYDASRLSEKDVEAALVRYQVPIKRVAAVTVE
jgi:copper chaperone CopZ